MRYKLLIITVLFLIVACGNGDSNTSGQDGVVLVEVDGTPVTLDMLERAMEARDVDENDHERMRELLNELIRMQAVANAARAEELAADPQVQAELRLREIQTLYRHYINQAQRAEPVTDEEVRAAYDAQLERSGDTQYRIEVIAYEDQARALKAIRRLKDDELSYSALKSEAEAAGLTVDEPGWIDLSQVPGEFAALLAETETGSVVSQPMNNSRGWFVVHVAEKRDLQVPSFEQVREGIARTLLKQRREALIESLYDQAEITPMLPLEQADSETGGQQ